MCDGQVCDASGCYGSCPTSTRCSRIRCRPIQRCPPGKYVQRAGCGCSCRLPAPEKCPTGVKVKDFINEYFDDLIIFKDYYALLRSTPPSKKKGGKGGKQGRNAASEQQKVFGDGSDLDNDDDDEGLDDESSRRKRAEHEKLKKNVQSKLFAFFDDALKNGLLDPKKGKKRSSKYYKRKLGIDIMCPHTCTPLCCEELDQ